ncbi:MAG: low specificity L-threonine aldolase [Rhizobiales bacterium]|nr:low specificity L-threonine aldolase [Hyphomicrobiales bacterium]
MNFASDNVWGVAAPIMAALEATRLGADGAYGGDDLTSKLEARFSEVFERDVSMYLVPTGTAANALAAAAYCPPFGTIFCHGESHLYYDEWGAAEFYTGGAKLESLAGDGGIVDPGMFSDVLDYFRSGARHRSTPSLFSLTQATEFGQVYSLDQISTLTGLAKASGLATHMDGARFANALASLSCSPAEMTWKVGIDCLSFGATKNGVMGAEALLFLDGKAHDDMEARRMRGGLLMSKSRFLSAQLLAYLADNLWLEMAGKANDCAKVLGAGLARSKEARLAWPVAANEVFAILSNKQDQVFRDAGAIYNPWHATGPDRVSVVDDGEILVRMVASPETPMESVQELLALTIK